MTEPTKDSVQLGAAFLDGHVPGWEDRIDPERLDLGDGCDCILGQLYGRYEDGLAELRLTQYASTALGFDSRGRRAKFGWLTRWWRQEIILRRLRR